MKCFNIIYFKDLLQKPRCVDVRNQTFLRQFVSFHIYIPPMALQGMLHLWNCCRISAQIHWLQQKTYFPRVIPYKNAQNRRAGNLNGKFFEVPASTEECRKFLIGCKLIREHSVLPEKKKTEFWNAKKNPALRLASFQIRFLVVSDKLIQSI